MLLQDQRPLAPHFNVDDAKCKFFLRSATALSNIEIWGAGYFSVVHGVCSYELAMVVCSFPMRFLRYFACKSVVTNPMFIPNAITPVVRM